MQERIYKDNIVPDLFSTEHYGLRIGKIALNLLSSDLASIRQSIEMARIDGFKILFSRVVAGNREQNLVLEAIGGKSFGKLVSLKKVCNGLSENLNVSRD